MVYLPSERISVRLQFSSLECPTSHLGQAGVPVSWVCAPHRRLYGRQAIPLLSGVLRLQFRPFANGHSFGLRYAPFQILLWKGNPPPLEISLNRHAELDPQSQTT